MKLKKFYMLIIVIVLTIAISGYLILAKKSIKLDNNTEDNYDLKDNNNIKNDNNSTDKNSFLNNIETNNKVCAYNHKLDLFRCNNIIDEKYDIHDNLIYIKTNDKEYFYDYEYENENSKNIKKLTFDSNTFEFEYDYFDRISKIIFVKNNNIKKIEYEYINFDKEPYIDGTYYIPIRINVFNNDKLEYYYYYERDIENVRIIENKYKNNVKVEAKIFHSFNDKAPKIFEILNYVPEPYINNNYYTNILYKKINSSLFVNFSYYQKDYDKIDNINIFSENYCYDDNNNYIIKYYENSLFTENDIEFIAFKKNDKYFKKLFKRKSYYNKNYVEISRNIELTEKDYNALFIIN